MPEAVPPPSEHSVLVVQTPCFTLMSPVAQTSLGNCTILNNENPVEGREIMYRRQFWIKSYFYSCYETRRHH